MAALLLAALSGCAVGEQEPVQAGSPRPELAEQAEVAARNLTSKPSASNGKGSSGAPGTASGQAAPSGTAAPGNATATTQPDPDQGTDVDPAGPPWTVLTRVADPAADQGNGPAYADLSGLTVSESDDRLRIEVTVSGTVPARLQDREVQGLGIDFYRSSSLESDYQVFLDGGGAGWRAFLQTPDGFVQFPGAFALDGETFSVEIPWAAVGGRRGAQVSTFLDWSSGTSRHSTDSASKADLQPR